MADPIHVHSQFDPEARAIAIVEEVEREALDEDMVSATLQRMMQVFGSRCERSNVLINEARVAQVKEERGRRLRAHEKGVKAQPPKPNLVQVPEPRALKAVNGSH
jgi:hypothetical protein